MVWINIVPDENKLIAGWKDSHGYTVPNPARWTFRGERLQAETETPTHYLLDAKGNVLSKHVGYKAGDEKTLDEEIQKALQQ